MTTPPTILALKQAFLEQETRRLAQPLAPSRAWRRANRERRHGSRRQQADEVEAGTADGAGSHAQRPLPERAVDDALFRANQLLRQHARRVYAPQAVRHVAEQLDQLYWQASEGAGGEETGADERDDVFSRGTDYTNPDVIAALPAVWEDAQTAEALPLEARRYAELVAQLQDLSTRRAAAEARVRRLRRLAAMVAPLAETETETETKTEDQPALGHRQDNVVTRNGPVERELERMRVLLARVGDRVGSLQQSQQNQQNQQSQKQNQQIGKQDDDADVEAAARRRTRALLEQF